MEVVRTKLRMKRPRAKSDQKPLEKKKKIAIEELTPTEMNFKKYHEKVFEKNIDQKIRATHKEKVEKFNKKLTDLAEHYDIPRVGPG